MSLNFVQKTEQVVQDSVLLWKATFDYSNNLIFNKGPRNALGLTGIVFAGDCMRKFIFIMTSFTTMALTACGGADAPTSAAAAVTPSVSASATSGLDAAGSWNVTGRTCQGFPVVNTIPAAIRSTENSVQTFEGCANLEYVACSEGTLNTQTGEMTLCYSDTLSTCTIRCTGIYVAGSPVTLTCNDLPSGTCTMTISK